MARLDLKPILHTHPCHSEPILNCGYRLRCAELIHENDDEQTREIADKEKKKALTLLNELLQQAFSAGREYQRKAQDKNQHYNDIS